MEGASFGAGRAGGGFDPVEFLKQPQTILRIISWSQMPLMTSCLALAAVWTFLWFVSFCFLADQWRKTSYRVHQGADAARAGIVFSFFSIFSWSALAVKALQRYRLGTDMSLFAGDQFGSAPNAGYPGYPTGSGVETTTDTYQSPPFTENMDSNTKDYQAPSY
ncbi:hypothetical protein XELAEV_18047750mg [Xenopus laevis]|uniref:MARVEL domain-containing protein n=1 Tax=Xenopus laevis TaxID=8355 RepID=A0A974BVU4_XENLA|nr:hypothetical protein XELAEV_18047750mg [Xenopus laevis]